MRQLALALFLSVLAGCATRLAPPLERPLSRRARLTFDDELDADERLELCREADLAERVYLGAMGGEPPRVLSVHFHGGAGLPLEVTRAAGLPDLRRGRYGGLCQRTIFGARIRVGAGLLGGVGSLEHELHHARIGDGAHKSPSWRRVNRLRYAWR